MKIFPLDERVEARALLVIKFQYVYRKTTWRPVKPAAKRQSKCSASDVKTAKL